MRATIDGAGRLVIPKSLRDRLGLVPGPVEVGADGAALRVEAIAEDGLEDRDGRLVIPPAGVPRGPGGAMGDPPARRPPRRRDGAVVARCRPAVSPATASSTPASPSPSWSRITNSTNPRRQLSRTVGSVWPAPPPSRPSRY